MSQLLSNMRRFSRSSSQRKNGQTPQSPTSYTGPNTVTGPSGGAGAFNTTGTGGGLRDRALGEDYMVLPSGETTNEGRPISGATDASFDFANRPVSGTTTGTAANRVSMGSRIPQNTGVGLSRTDQIVLQHFWESKYQESTKRDLHYLKFPYFPQYPSHRDLLPYCEIYHLVKTSPGASIVSLGSANGVYIGFELATGSQLHIDLDDDWFTSTSTTSITHHRIAFRPYSSIVADPNSTATFKSWPKPLTIEFLEDQYQAWCRDLMSICWESKEVRELGAGGAAAPTTAGPGASATGVGGGPGSVTKGEGSITGSTGGAGRNPESLVDDGYASERSTGQEI